MYAIIKTGGKQYRVAEGDVITIEKLEAAAEESVTFDEVLYKAKSNYRRRQGHRQPFTKVRIESIQA